MADVNALLAQVDQSLFGFPDSVTLQAPTVREMLRLARAGRQALAAWENSQFGDDPGPCVLGEEDGMIVVDGAWFAALGSAIDAVRSPSERQAREVPT